MPLKLIVAVFFLGIVTHSLSARASAQFSLRLLPSNIDAAAIETIDPAKLRPTLKPLLTEDDVLRYDEDDHRLVLSLFAGDRLQRLKISRAGQPFAVFVGADAIYAGMLFDGYSFETYRGVAADVAPLGQFPPSLLLELDYPPLAPKNPASDPRGDRRLIEAFRQSGKLYRDAWIEAVAVGARATGKRRQSYVFEFSVKKVTKGEFPDKSVVFEVFADADSSELFDLVSSDETTKPKRFLLKFHRQVAEQDARLWYQGFERLE